MAAMVSRPSPIQRIRPKRFTTSESCYYLWDLSVSFSGNIAVSGYHENSKETFIDLYSRNSASPQDKFELFHSKRLKKYANEIFRCASFLENNSKKIVTCIDHKLRTFDVGKKKKELRSRKVELKTVCLAVRHKEIFIGFHESQTLIVFNNNLHEPQNIHLQGLEVGDYPCDLNVVKDTIFVCTFQSKALAIRESDGRTITNYEDDTGSNSGAYSITASEGLGFVAVLWGWRRIILYSLYDTALLSIVEVDSVSKIRILDKDKMMVTGTWNTGEIKVFSLEHLFNYDAMKESLVPLLNESECPKLVNLFAFTENQIELILKSSTPTYTFLLALEEEGLLQPFNVERLTDALMKISLSCYNVVEIYKNARREYEPKPTYKELTEQLKTKEEADSKEKQELNNRLQEYERGANVLRKKLDEVNKEKTELSDSVQELTEKIRQSESALDPVVKESTYLETTRLSNAQYIEILTLELEQTKNNLHMTMFQSQYENERLNEELKHARNDIAELKKDMSDRITILQENVVRSKGQIASIRQETAGSVNKVEPLQREMKGNNQTINQITVERDEKRSELNQCPLDFAEELRVLKEVLNQEKPATFQLLQETAEGRSEDVFTSLKLDDTRNKVVLQIMPLQTEGIIDQQGGTLEIPNSGIRLEIPGDALPKEMEKCVVKMRIIPSRAFEDPEPSFASYSSVVVEILPNNIRLRRAAQLTLPHCLVTNEVEEHKAKTFMSHHSEGKAPHWTEQTDVAYVVEESLGIIWLNRFCWVTIKINDESVKAKKLVLYTAGVVLKPNDKFAEIQVGYHLDLASEAEFLQLNKSIVVSQKKTFHFMKKGEQPLSLLLQDIISSGWRHRNPEKNPLQISFKSIAASFEHSCLFILEKTTNDADTILCIFEASQKQGQQPVELMLRLEHALTTNSDISTQPRTLGASFAEHPNQSKEEAKERQEKTKDMDSLFQYLSKAMGLEWKEVGRNLKLQHGELHHIKENNNASQEINHAMLLHWKQKEGSGATYGMLMHALQDAGRKDLAEYVRDWEGTPIE